MRCVPTFRKSLPKEVKVEFVQPPELFYTDVKNILCGIDRGVNPAKLHAPFEEFLIAFSKIVILFEPAIF